MRAHEQLSVQVTKTSMGLLSGKKQREPAKKAVEGVSRAKEKPTASQKIVVKSDTRGGASSSTNKDTSKHPGKGQASKKKAAPKSSTPKASKSKAGNEAKPQKQGKVAKELPLAEVELDSDADASAGDASAGDKASVDRAGVLAKIMAAADKGEIKITTGDDGEDQFEFHGKTVDAEIDTVIDTVPKLQNVAGKKSAAVLDKGHVVLATLPLSEVGCGNFPKDAALEMPDPEGLAAMRTFCKGAIKKGKEAAMCGSNFVKCGEYFVETAWPFQMRKMSLVQIEVQHTIQLWAFAADDSGNRLYPRDVALIGTKNKGAHFGGIVWDNRQPTSVHICLSVH